MENDSDGASEEVDGGNSCFFKVPVADVAVGVDTDCDEVIFASCFAFFCSAAIVSVTNAASESASPSI